MSEAADDRFYRSLPVIDGFGRLMDPAQYRPLPEDWAVGVADIVQSTGAIEEGRYKAVNMAGAAVIASVSNALGDREFPFIFGGDGASFAVPARDAGLAAEALAATANWVERDLSLVMRVALVPVKAIRANGSDVRVARFAPSPNLSYAMFSGGGLGWAEAAMKRGDFLLPKSDPDLLPDLSGLSCRFSEIPAANGLILSLMAVPAPGTDAAAFRRLAEAIVALVEASPNGGRPVPAAGPPLTWPPPGADLEARARRGASLPLRRAWIHVSTLFSFLVLRLGIRIGGFVPRTYITQLVENSDFRKYDDGLRMVLDCTPRLADVLERRLADAAADGIARYGLHRQDAAMMTCFTPAPWRSDHVHFVDGARGGYARAASALKASAA